MKLRQIEVSTDTFAALWGERKSDEHSEEDIIRRLLGLNLQVPDTQKYDAAILPVEQSIAKEMAMNRPPSIKWTELLVWSLKRLGGEAALGEIYQVSREGRRALGRSTTLHHDDSARECLESHCSDSKKYRGKADLFWMPHGKGAGVWALR